MSVQPSQFGRYEVTGEIGAGAMGRVYRGFDPLVRRAVAIKTLKRELLAPGEADDALRRFQREAQAAGALSHPHIVNVFDVGADYIVMELLDGVPLQALLRERGRLTLAETVALLRPVAGALDHAHAAGVIHRDIKPGNIMVLPDGRPKVMDFGLARVESASATRPGEVFGSPSYMAPEQAAGDEISSRVDVYALAVVAYECVTGHKPFESAHVAGIIHKVLHEPAPTPRRLAPALPESADAVFAHALAKDPKQRYANAGALLDALEGLLPESERTLSGAASTLRALAPSRAPGAPSGEPGGVTQTYDDLQEPLARTPRPGVGLRTRAPVAAWRRVAWAFLGAAALAAVAFVATSRRPTSAPASPPPAAAAHLRVLSEPAGARVFVDERDVGAAPLQVEPLAPGRHTVRVAREGFAPAQLSLDVAAGQTLAPLSFVLQPLTATLSVTSRPAGAEVRLGDQLLGRTPLERLPVPPGVYELRVEQSGYAPWKRTVSAGAGETERVEAVLTAGERGANGALRTGDLVQPGTPGVTEPVRTSGRDVSYPPLAQAARLQGSVLFALIVDEFGRPTKVHVVESAGQVLDRAVLDAVNTWRFRPARKDGVKVKYPLLRRQTFKLD